MMNMRPNAWTGRLLLSLAVGLAILLVVIVLLGRAFGETDVRVAKPAPPFVLKDARSQVIKLADFKDKALIICFFAMSDNPSQKQVGILNDLLKKYSETNLAVLGLALSQTGYPSTEDYAAQQHLRFPLYVADYNVVMAFGSLTAIPTTFVIDKNQNIIQKYVGVTETNVLDADVKAILKQ
jgi:peroxiredoxin